MAIQKVMNSLMVNPHEAIEKVRKVNPGVTDLTPADTSSKVRKKGKTPAGVGDVPTRRIPNTPEEIRKDDFISNKSLKEIDGDKSNVQIAKEREVRLELIKAGTREVLNDALKVNEQSFSDDFQFEKVMLAYYKAMTACMRSQTTAMISATKELERELEKMSEEREKEYQKIFDRMGREKWFDGLTLAGIVAGGSIAATVSSGGAAAPLAVAGAAFLGLLQVDKMFDHPMKKIASMFTPEPVLKASEAVIGIAGTIMFGLNPTAILPAMVANGIAQIGTQYTNCQNKASDGELEQLSNQSKLDTDKIDDLGEMARFISESLKTQTNMVRQVMKPQRFFS